MWIASFILISPLYIWHHQQLIPDEYTCRVTKDDSIGVAYSMLITFGIPFMILAFIYFQVHRFLRRQATSTSLEARSRSQHRQRDVLVFRRIVIVVTLLGSYGMPTAIMLIMLAITHELVPSFYRILELSCAACVLTLSVALIYVNSQVRKEIENCRQKDRVEAVGTRKFQLRQQKSDHNRVKTRTRVL